MFKIIEYYGRYQGLRGNLGGLPPWARLIIFVAAIPGIALLALSILAFGVSILALLLLTVPTYRLLRWFAGAPRRSAMHGAAGLNGFSTVGSDGDPFQGQAAPFAGEDNGAVNPLEAMLNSAAMNGSSGQPKRRHVDVKIIE